jgi:hypothetical protein
MANPTMMAYAYIKIDADKNQMANDDLSKLEENWREEINDKEVGPTRIFKVCIECPVPRATEIDVKVEDTESTIDIKVSNKE